VAPQADWSSLRPAFDAAPVLVAILRGPEHVFAYVNPRYVETTGHDPVGRRATELYPQLRGLGLLARLDLAYRSGQAYRDDEVPVPLPLLDGLGGVDTRSFSFSYAPLPAADGSVDGVVFIAVETTEQVRTRGEVASGRLAQAALERRAERSAERVNQLEGAAAALALALTVERVVEVVVHAARAGLGASSGSVALLEHRPDGDVLVWSGRPTQLPAAASAWPVIPVERGLPVAVAARTATPVFLPDLSALREWLPEEERGAAGELGEEQAWAAVPLVGVGAPLGVLRLAWPDPHALDGEERAAVLALAGQCAAAIARARLLETSRAASAALARSEHRYRALVETAALDVWVADASGSLATDMPRWRELTGGSRRLEGRQWLVDVHAEDRDAAAEQWALSLRTGQPYDALYRLCIADGTDRWIRARAVPVLEPAREHGTPEIVEWVGTTEDVTDQRATAQRATTLQRVTAALAGALAVPQVIGVMSVLGAETIDADLIGVALLDGARSGLTFHPVHGVDAEAMAAWQGRSLDDSALTTAAVRTGEAVFLRNRTSVPPDLRDPAVLRFLAAGEQNAWAVLPLSTVEEPFGALVLGFTAPQRFPSEEREFLLALAQQCASAIDRAVLYQRQQSTARILQRALLPERLPDVAGLVASARYEAAGASDVGGDWYDLFPVGDSAAFVLGDVMGRGVRAASVMGQVRNALRGFAAQDPSPAHVLRGLDRLFATFSSEELVTLVYGLVHSDGTLDYASAGHVPPLLVVPGSGARFLDAAGSTPLGVDLGERSSGRDHLPPGSLLCLYSDGLVERRDQSLDVGMAALAAAASALVSAGADVGPGGAARAVGRGFSAADSLLERMLGGRNTDDDVSLLVLQRLASHERSAAPEGSARAPVRAAETSLPPDRSSAPLGRRWLRRQCEAWGLGALGDLAELLTSELVTNAIVHAQSPLLLRAEVVAGRLRVAVSDEDVRPPTLADRGVEALGGRGLALIDALADAWGVQAREHVPGKTVYFELPLDSSGQPG